MKYAKCHLVSYGTFRYWPRLLFLGLSARLNGVADTFTAWTPKRLLASGFEQVTQSIPLSERGSGYWAWKPYIINEKLLEIPEGDIVLYCDIGRSYPYKLLDQPLDGFINWMKQNNQEYIPGVEIPWNGPISAWTKRDALVLTECDVPDTYVKSPIQASFSIWVANMSSRKFVKQWLDLCIQRRLISDDSSICGLGELPGFIEHRHDQALLTLCCYKFKARSLNLGSIQPAFDAKHPSRVSRELFGESTRKRVLAHKILHCLASIIAMLEKIFRNAIKFQ